MAVKVDEQTYNMVADKMGAPRINSSQIKEQQEALNQKISNRTSIGNSIHSGINTADQGLSSIAQQPSILIHGGSGLILVMISINLVIVFIKDLNNHFSTGSTVQKSKNGTPIPNASNYGIIRELTGLWIVSLVAWICSEINQSFGVGMMLLMTIMNIISMNSKSSSSVGGGANNVASSLITNFLPASYTKHVENTVKQKPVIETTKQALNDILVGAMQSKGYTYDSQNEVYQSSGSNTNTYTGAQVQVAYSEVASDPTKKKQNLSDALYKELQKLYPVTTTK